MRKHLFTTLLSPAIICMSLSLSTFEAHSVSTVTQLKAEGYRACKSIGHGGWTGIVSAVTLDGSSRAGLRKVRVRYCFTSKGECKQFINNFKNLVTGLDSIQLKKCSPR